MSREQEVGGWAGLEDCHVMEVRQAEQALRRCDNLCGEGADYPCRSPTPAEGVGGGLLYLSCSLAPWASCQKWPSGKLACNLVGDIGGL